MFLLAASLFLSLTACGGREKDTGGTDTGGTDTSETGDTGDTDTGDTDTGTVTGFTVSGTLIDLSIGAPLSGTGLSVAVADPTPALAGGEMEILATGTVDAAGVSSAAYAGLGDGDVLSGVSAYVVTSTLATGVNGSIAAVGGSHDIVTEGALFGFVFDVTGTPVAGAQAGCSGCGTPDFYYADHDPTDGLFSTGMSANTGTDPLANAMFVVPGAPIASYFADDGGTHDFVSQLGGSLPGFAAFISINATN